MRIGVIVDHGSQRAEGGSSGQSLLLSQSRYKLRQGQQLSDRVCNVVKIPGNMGY
jgi:hypothetical protein